LHASRHLVSPTGATLHELAVCHERQGKTASAWAEYLEAATVAQREKRADVGAAARRRAAAIEPRLSTLAVRVAPGFHVAGLEVRRDGLVLDPAAFGTAAPVDPGEHVVVATAPGKRAWRRSVIVRAVPGATVVDVGPLDDAPAAAGVAAAGGPPAGTATLTSATYPASSRGAADASDAEHGGSTPADAATSPGPSTGTTQRVLGLVVAGTGLVGLGLGAYFGVQTFDKSDAARAACPTSPCPDRAAVELNDEAKASGVLSTVSFAAGAGALLAGSILYFTAPSGSSGPSSPGNGRAKAAPSVGVAVTPAYSGVRVGGTF